MKKSDVLLIIFISNLISSYASDECFKKSSENYLDFNGFMDRDNSDITYLTTNNETEIEACEMVDEIYDCYENGELVEQDLEKSYVRMKYYSQNKNTSVSNLTFYSYFDCLNYLIRDEVKKEDSKIYIKKYLGPNENVTEIIIDVKNGESKNIEIFCNNGSDTKNFHVDEKLYSGDRKSEMSFSFEDLIDFGDILPVPFSDYSSSSFLSNDLVNYTIDKVKENTYKSNWIRRRSSQDLLVPAHSGKILSQREVKEKKYKEYTANFEIEDSLENEDSKRFRAFRQKLRDGQVKLYQRKNDLQIDFSGEDSIFLRNLRIKEYVDEFENVYFLNDTAACAN